MSAVFDLFCLVSNKDVFASIYTKNLAHRLLYNKSLDEPTEKAFINKLKLECGTVYTKKMETMFIDLSLSA